MGPTIENAAEKTPVAQALELCLVLPQVPFQAGHLLHALHEHQAFFRGGPEVEHLFCEPAPFGYGFFEVSLKAGVLGADLF